MRLYFFYFPGHFSMTFPVFVLRAGDRQTRRYAQQYENSLFLIIIIKEYAIISAEHVPVPKKARLLSWRLRLYYYYFPCLLPRSSDRPAPVAGGRNAAATVTAGGVCTGNNCRPAWKPTLIGSSRADRPCVCTSTAVTVSGGRPCTGVGRKPDNVPCAVWDRTRLLTTESDSSRNQKSTSETYTNHICIYACGRKWTGRVRRTTTFSSKGCVPIKVRIILETSSSYFFYLQRG